MIHELYINYEHFLDITDLFIGSNLLANKSFPIIFDSISGVCQQDDQSYYNSIEVIATIKYVNKILEGTKTLASDIGIYSFTQYKSTSAQATFLILF